MSSTTSLPPELLLEIFGYLTPEELLENVQNVCTSWRAIACHPSLWEDFVYSPECNPTFEEAIRFVQKCPMLKHINIYIGTYIEKVGPEEFVTAVIENCSDVRTFCVEFGSYFLTLLQIDALFEAFPNLEFFKIHVDSRNGALAIQTLESIRNCTRLKKLVVRSNSFCDGWLKLIVDGCISLEYLNFDCPAVLENDFRYILENMKHRLSYVKFSNSQPVTHYAVREYSLFTKLEYLRLDHQREFGRVNFCPLTNIKTLKNLSLKSDTFSISDVETIYDTLFNSPFPCLQKLTVNIFRCKWRKDVVKDICRCYTKLKSLQLVYKTRDVEDSFEDIYRLEHLEKLVCRMLTDSDVAYVACCPRLKHLTLEGSDELTDATVEHLVRCRLLEYVDLRYTSISGRSLHMIPGNLCRLKELLLYGTTAKQECLQMLANNMPSTRVAF